MKLTFNHVYVHSCGCAICEKGASHLNKKQIDYVFKDDLCEENNFEKAERALIRKACDAAVRKSNKKISDIDCALGADLNNQLSASHYFIRDYEIPFIGMYAACASSSLLLNQASMMIDSKQCDNILLFTSSNFAVATRQFRYHNANLSHDQ